MRRQKGMACLKLIQLGSMATMSTRRWQLLLPQRNCYHAVRRMHFVGVLPSLCSARRSALQRSEHLEQCRTLPKHSRTQAQYVCFYDDNYRTEFVRQKSQTNTLPQILPFAAQPYAQELKGDRLFGDRKSYRGTSGRSSSRARAGFSQGFLSRVFIRLAKLAGGLLTVFGLALAGAPSFLSWPSGLDTIVYLVNCSIPGTLSVGSASLGWTEPIRVERLFLKGTDETIVLSVPLIETKAHLWSLVAGRSGLGDSTITAPSVDIRKDTVTGQPYLDLALSPPEKLQFTNPYVKKHFTVLPAAEVAWTAKARAPGGDLQVINGKVIMPADMAAVLGSNLLLDFALGKCASRESVELREGKKGHPGGVPIRSSLWSNCAHLEALAYLNRGKRRIELVQAMKAEMDLSPALAKFYLARINPLLGEIVGPAIDNSDLPDVTMHVTPAAMVWPANEYSIRIEPMKVVLAKGQFLEKVVALLSRRELQSGKWQLTMQTSAVEATVHLSGNVACSRVDLLIADRVHVATWGLMDHMHETVKMTLAIPGKSLRDLLGITTISPEYHLKIPINGTFDRPIVDWVAAGRGIGQLTVHRTLGSGLLSSFIDQFDETDPIVPQPIGDLPWAPT